MKPTTARDLRKRLGPPDPKTNRHHLVGMSGGKDSCALGLRLRELHPARQFVFYCTPTGDELPDMVAHWDRLGCLLGAPLLYVRNRTLADWIEEFDTIPNSRLRFCTRVLKIEPAQTLAALAVRPVMYVGLRADEPAEQRTGLESDRYEQRYPLREWGWGLAEVLRYLGKRGVTIPRRTDCARCYHQRLGEWWQLWADYRSIWDDAEEQERRVSESRKRPCTFRNATRDTWPAALSGLRGEFERGRRPRGAGQMGLFGENTNQCRVCRL